jgi:hypothetical protein
LDDLDKSIKSGSLHSDKVVFVVTVKQQKILNSSVYLQLYNLIEATVTKGLEIICNSAIVENKHKPADLNQHLRKEWVRAIGKTHVSKTSENRLKDAVSMCNHLTDALPINEFTIEAGGGGNWDDIAIEKITQRIGCNVQFTPETYSGVKRPVRNDLGPLALVVNLRNRLAHGSISFEECGQSDTVNELRSLTLIVVTYLRELVTAIENYMELKLYLKEELRPAA